MSAVAALLQAALAAYDPETGKHILMRLMVVDADDYEDYASFRDSMQVSVGVELDRLLWAVFTS